jgi:GT2 family glycosyltransferase/glycosyltransferase involved in cell wall biosynthesis
VPSASHLTPVALAFASGTATQNRAMLERFAAAYPSLPLYVVSEFQPARGQWIPWHVLRSPGENVAAIRAALNGCRVQAAAMALARGTAYGKMRLVAVRLCGGHLVAYDADLKVASLAAVPLWFIRGAAPVEGGRLHKWIRRLAHPSESEIPVRARLAQVRAVVSNRFRGEARELPLRGEEALAEGVSVVIPSRDGRELLGTMLPNLLAQLTRGEVIVVDNGSGDGTADWLAREHPAIRVIQSPAPLSFARAVNAGIVAARFGRTLLLNNDMVVEPGFMAALEDAFRRIPNLYCATAQIFFPPGIRREETGKAVWRREDPLDFPMRCDDPCAGEDLTWVFYGSGGCSLFDTAKLREMGGVSEVYEPAYVEDMDFGYRAWKRGWPSVYCASARVEHRHRATTARFYTPRQLEFFVERNYLRFLIHAVSSPALFEKLWVDAIRRLQLLAMNGSEAALDALRDIPGIGPRPAVVAGLLSESEIFALGNGDVACFPGRVPRGFKTILIASPYLPFPLSHGGAVRVFNLMKHAAASHDLVLMAYCDELSTPSEEVLALCCEVVLVKRHGSHYRRDTPRPDVVEEFDSETFRACLKQTAYRWKPAVVQLEFTWMAQFADAWPNAKTILVEHDITFELQEQLLRSSTETGAARWELERQAAKWRAFETDAWREVDCVVTMSEKDSGMVTGAKSVVMLPNGVDCERFQPSEAAPEPGRLLFIGSFAHLPNLLALEFFVKEVWPLFHGKFVLHIIAGANPEYYLDFHRQRVTVDLNKPGIEVEAFVADVRMAYRRAELVVAPLTASAGTNIKVLEAMAMGRVVVSTPAGINGLDLRPGCDVIVASAAADLAAEIQALSADPERRLSIEQRARQTALLYDWRAISEIQERIYS